MKFTDQNIKVTISKDNCSIKFDGKHCISCGECARICSKVMSVNNNYDINVTKEPICVNCGQCIKSCPTNALCGVDEYKVVKQLIKDKNKIVVVSTAPAVRVALGDEFGLKRGSFVQGKMVSLLKKLGFKYVLDVNFGADLTVYEEAYELIERLKSNNNLPLFTSCCPSWVKFVETFYPELLPNLSTCKSPISMQGAIIKTYFAKQMGIDANNIVNVALTPCVAKKFEIRREELNSSAQINNNAQMRDTDYVITTTELASWAKEQSIDFKSLKDEQFDNILGESSGAGVIFGNTGGVMEATVRTAYKYLTNNEPDSQLLEFKQVRGLGRNGIKCAEVVIDNKTLKLACVNGLSSARDVIALIKNGEHFDFVEVMACPGGCIGGGGQPKQLGEEKYTQKARIDSLYERDKSLECRSAHNNKQIQSLYKNYLDYQASPLAKTLLHTTYKSRKKI